MKVAISYFYKVRFFQPNMIPFSTAIWDPKWYHDFKGQNHIFFDKRGVVNGLRVPMLVPPPWTHDACRGFESCPVKDPTSCAFLYAYNDYINTKDQVELLRWLYTACEKIRLRSNYEGEEIAVILVHEKPGVQCSERIPLDRYFSTLPCYIGELNI